MEHYYTKNPTIAHDISRIEYKVLEVELLFNTDAGVFSKEKVDFGSHVMIKTLPKLAGRVLDLGCGYGAIGITLAKLNPEADITMVDINERAVALANENTVLNKVKNARALQSDGFENVSGVYNTIVCNPPIRTGKKVIYSLFESSIAFLERAGEIYLVIQKKQGAESAMNKLRDIYGNCEVIYKEGGYWIIRSIKEG